MALTPIWRDVPREPVGHQADWFKVWIYTKMLRYTCLHAHWNRPIKQRMQKFEADTDTYVCRQSPERELEDLGSPTMPVRFSNSIGREPG